jgi:hypothetical protein
VAGARRTGGWPIGLQRCSNKTTRCLPPPALMLARHTSWMEPVTLSLIVVKWGADQVAKALLGDTVGGLLGSLVGELLGVVSTSEKEVDQLDELRTDIRNLSDQRYRVAQTSAARYLRQGLLEGRSSTDKERDLFSAQGLLIEAASAAPSGLERGQSELLLVMTRLALGDRVGADDAADQLELCVGQGAADVDRFKRSPGNPAPVLASLAQSAMGTRALRSIPRRNPGPKGVHVERDNRAGVILDMALGEFDFAGVAGILRQAGPDEVHLSYRSSATTLYACVTLDPSFGRPANVWLEGCQPDQDHDHHCLYGPDEGGPKTAIRPGETLEVSGFTWFHEDEQLHSCLVLDGGSRSLPFSTCNPGRRSSCQSARGVTNHVVRDMNWAGQNPLSSCSAPAVTSPVAKSRPR